MKLEWSVSSSGTVETLHLQGKGGFSLNFRKFRILSLRYYLKYFWNVLVR